MLSFSPRFRNFNEWWGLNQASTPPVCAADGRRPLLSTCLRLNARWACGTCGGNELDCLPRLVARASVLTASCDDKGMKVCACQGPGSIIWPALLLVPYWVAEHMLQHTLMITSAHSGAHICTHRSAESNGPTRSKRFTDCMLHKSEDVDKRCSEVFVDETSCPMRQSLRILPWS